MLTATKPKVLRQVLHTMCQKGTCSLTDLARELSISEDLLRRILMTLVEGGYLQRVSDECARRCSTCSLQEICLAPGSAVWIMTEKGRRALQA
jgi:predicted ArsR family transcriptional regulator